MQRKIFVYSNSIFVKIYIKDVTKRNAKIILAIGLFFGMFQIEIEFYLSVTS